MKHCLLTLFILVTLGSFAQNDAAIESYNQGITLYNQKDYTAALVYFDKSIAADPAFAKAVTTQLLAFLG